MENVRVQNLRKGTGIGTQENIRTEAKEERPELGGGKHLGNSGDPSGANIRGPRPEENVRGQAREEVWGN